MCGENEAESGIWQNNDDRCICQQRKGSIQAVGTYLVCILMNGTDDIQSEYQMMPSSNILIES